MMRIDNWGFSRRDASEILGLAESTIANWQTRYNLFPEAKAGKGYQISFDLKRLVKLATMKALVDARIPPETAAQMLRRQTPYGHILHNRTAEIVFTFDGATWVASDNPDALCSISIRIWAILDALWPRFCKAVLSDPRDIASDVLARGLTEFREKLEELRPE